MSESHDQERSPEDAGLSPSATAYHLKLLERYGAVEAATPRPDRRERPWRAAGRRFQADLDTSAPARASAAAAVAAAHFDATRAIAANSPRARTPSQRSGRMPP